MDMSTNKGLVLFLGFIIVTILIMFGACLYYLAIKKY